MQQVQAGLHQTRMRQAGVDAVLHAVGQPGLPFLRRDRVGAQDGGPDVLAGQDRLQAGQDVPGAGVLDVDHHPATAPLVVPAEIQQGLLLGVQALVRQSRRRGDGQRLQRRSRQFRLQLGDPSHLARIVDGLFPEGTVHPAQQGLQVGAQQPLGVVDQRLFDCLVQVVGELLVDARLGVVHDVAFVVAPGLARFRIEQRQRLRVHAHGDHPFPVGRQVVGHIL